MTVHKLVKAITLTPFYVSCHIVASRTSSFQALRSTIFFTMGDSHNNGAKKAANQWDRLRVGKLHLEHRVVMSPLTRARCPAGLPSEMNVEYYSQRATKGGLMISEGIHPSLMVRVTRFQGSTAIASWLTLRQLRVVTITTFRPCIPPEHIRSWKKVTDTVHAKGGFIFTQIWHVSCDRESHARCHGLELSIGRQNLSPILLGGPQTPRTFHHEA